MAEMKVELNGKTAIVAVVIVVAIVLFRLVSYDTTLPPEAEAVVKEKILNDYRRHWLARTDITDEQKTDELLKLEDIPFVSIKGKGDKYERIVRIEIAPNNVHPSGMDYVQYLKLTRSMGTAWREEGFATARMYKMKLF
jgi:hypothetical protein